MSRLEALKLDVGKLKDAQQGLIVVPPASPKKVKTNFALELHHNT